MSYDKQRVSLICQGTFDTLHTGLSPDNTNAIKAQMLQAATEIGQAGFGTVILGQWHVHEDGSVYYNGAQYYPTGSTTPPGALDFDWIFTTIPAKLRELGVQHIELEFGGWNCNDFNHIQSNLAKFKDTMQDFFNKYPDIDGLDFDPEGDDSTYYSSEVGQALAELTQWLAGQNKIATAVPYTNVPFWQGVLQALKKADKGQFSWWNLQGAESPENYGSWVDAVKNTVSNPESFITYGFNFDTVQSSPTDVTTSLQAAQKQYSGLSGAFIWKYEDIKKTTYTAHDYGQALQTGLEGNG